MSYSHSLALRPKVQGFVIENPKTSFPVVHSLASAFGFDVSGDFGAVASDKGFDVHWLFLGARSVARATLNFMETMRTGMTCTLLQVSQHRPLSLNGAGLLP